MIMTMAGCSSAANDPKASEELTNGDTAPTSSMSDGETPASPVAPTKGETAGGASSAGEASSDGGTTAPGTTSPAGGADSVTSSAETARPESAEESKTGDKSHSYADVEVPSEPSLGFDVTEDFILTDSGLDGPGGGFTIEPVVPIEPPVIPDIPEPYPEENNDDPAAGLLTGGEWRDNDHWEDWNALYSSHEYWQQYKSDWRISYDNRIAVKVTANGEPLEGARVSCDSAVCSAVTDNKGVAYLFYTAINGATEPITVSYGNATKQLDGVVNNASVECELSDVTPTAEKTLDFMIMCDTTGSMGDELNYLKMELDDIITRVKNDNANIPIRLSVNFYRDEGDDYVVRENPFTTDIDAACRALAAEKAAGGGDTPEAVHTALESALNNHSWDENSVKIMFIVLDAPPHNDPQVIDSVNKLIKQAAEMGVRIIPIASSGIDKGTEYLLRTMAFTTGGTYTFLTNDSGIGGSHIEPTVGAYNVEKLNDMMVRIVNGYLS